jgi:hypothetical protein
MRNSSGSRRLRVGWLAPVLLIAAAGNAVVGVAQSSAAPSAVPQVEIRAASQVTKTSATIEAAIDPEGGETSYEIFLECQSASPASRACEEPLTVGPQRELGVIAAGVEAHTVTASVTGLHPGYLYDYSVIASNSVGREGYVGNGLVTCPATGVCPSQPWLPGMALWGVESARKWAEEAPAREAERQAKQREAEERSAREVAERARTEREIRESGERAAREAAAREAAGAEEARSGRLGCVVPHLDGDSLAAARHALARARCALGKVTWPRARRERLVVGRQGVRGGRKLAAGAKVAITLRAAHH